MTTQAPTPGSKRDTRATLVRVWLRRNTGEATRKRYTYDGIASATGLSKPAVQSAVYDLRDHYPEDPMIVSVPCAGNEYTVEVGWRWAAKAGLANREGDLASRMESEATVLERAAAVETDPAKAFMYRSEAAQARLSSTRKRELADMMRHDAAAERGR